MSQQGAALQTYNNELVKCLEELCERRAEVESQIRDEIVEKVALEQERDKIEARLAEVNASLAKKQETKAKFDRTIEDTEKAYTKILESSQVLLNVLKKEKRELKI